MRVIRIAGGVGAGKSQVLSILREEYGARIILADEVAKRFLAPGQPLLWQVAAALGPEILDGRGALDRPRMAERIFKDPAALKTVDALTHPAVWKAIGDEVRNAREDLVAVEAAVMGEEEPEIYDDRWFVFASRETRIRRLEENRGYSREKSLSIMENQWTEEKFREWCGEVIDNDGPVEATRAQIAEILHKGQKKT